MSQSRRERPLTLRVHTVQNSAWGGGGRQGDGRGILCSGTSVGRGRRNGKKCREHYVQTLASKEHCNAGDRGIGTGEARRRGLDMGRDREGAPGGTGSLGKNERGS